MIKISELKKRFDKNEVLKGISLEFEKGSISAIMGPNGSGKTTLLKCILGLVKLDSGKIFVDEISVNGNSDYKKKIGYMAQVSCFPENLKVKEVINMIKDIRGNHIKYDEELLERLNVYEFQNKQIGTLSGGMKQRLNSAAAFLFGGDIIILDEPTAGLDPVSSEIVMDKILHEKLNNKLIILTSHLVNEVEALADRIIYLLEGKIYFDKTKEELFSLTGKENLNQAIAELIIKSEQKIL
jgi:Cu-processing system ATP-binding protein